MYQRRSTAQISWILLFLAMTLVGIVGLVLAHLRVQTRTFTLYSGSTLPELSLQLTSNGLVIGDIEQRKAYLAGRIHAFDLLKALGEHDLKRFGIKATGSVRERAVENHDAIRRQIDGQLSQQIAALEAMRISQFYLCISWPVLAVIFAAWSATSLSLVLIGLLWLVKIAKVTGEDKNPTPMDSAK